MKITLEFDNQEEALDALNAPKYPDPQAASIPVFDDNSDFGEVPF